jgi:selenide,water dikinase
MIRRTVLGLRDAMQRLESAQIKHLVLVGGGHTHLGLLERFSRRPLPGARLTVVCRELLTSYSGMLPGLIAGHYAFEDIHVDLRGLCRLAGARLLQDEVTGIDLDGRRVLSRSGPAVPYDLLSLNIGSAPDMQAVPGAAACATPVKPIQPFIAHWEALSTRALEQAGPLHIGVVGAGAAGVEILLAMQFRLRQRLAAAGRNPDQVHLSLFSESAHILPTHGARTRRIFERVLLARGIQVRTGQAVVALAPGRLTLADGSVYLLDEVFWATSAGAPAWIARSGLAVDAHGFVKVRETLQSPSHPEVFAAGDIATIVGHPRPKAGVFAVRAARPLAHNLRQAVLGQPLVPFRPQAQFLSLISTGDRYAVASRGRWVLKGRWMWRWKDVIDRRFVHRFHAAAA